MAKVISKNKSVFFNFEILEKYEVGLKLQGWEIKSIRASKVNLKGAFISFKNQEAYVSNMHIAQYMNNAVDETQPRKLLLHKKQLLKLNEKVKTKGLTIVPIVLKISAKGMAKLDIALVRGKSKIDKRQLIKERDIKRSIKNYY